MRHLVGCTGKVVYYSRREACRAKRKHNKRNTRPQHEYRCDHCAKFHLTSIPGAITQKYVRGPLIIELKL